MSESAPLTPDHTSRQGCLRPAPEGIDAHWAWLHPGGSGRGVTVVASWPSCRAPRSCGPRVPQQDAPGRPASQRIGNRPDIRAAVAHLLPEAVGSGTAERYWDELLPLSP
ncbi:hypothetical protein IQ62_32195 [Streptomyces scabiei]|uniref:hypothetical protein n=1 Tax=Streptomyces scabiei TaxID=1930 RepID=UPI0004E76179|nr:hypothetical protein [Streptomyces scabiei]KFF97194.1 hypothetical protein IQ62_32195 [Streptomyces scabiei]